MAARNEVTDLAYKFYRGDAGRIFHYSAYLWPQGAGGKRYHSAENKQPIHITDPKLSKIPTIAALLTPANLRKMAKRTLMLNFHRSRREVQRKGSLSQDLYVMFCEGNMVDVRLEETFTNGRIVPRPQIIDLKRAAEGKWLGAEFTADIAAIIKAWTSM